MSVREASSTYTRPKASYLHRVGGHAAAFVRENTMLTVPAVFVQPAPTKQCVCRNTQRLQYLLRGGIALRALYGT